MGCGRRVGEPEHRMRQPEMNDMAPGAKTLSDLVATRAQTGIADEPPIQTSQCSHCVNKQNAQGGDWCSEYTFTPIKPCCRHSCTVMRASAIRQETMAQWAKQRGRK